jgi:cysteine desulfurase / selenocysteine lyase
MKQTQLYLKDDFPIMKSKYNGNELCYLDSAATSQKPEVVIKSITDYYRRYNSNVHRGIYSISEEATKAYEDSHQIVGKFVNAKPDELIFTRGTTESLNLLAYSLLKKIKSGNIVSSVLEHHSNLVPWQQLGKERNIDVRYLDVDDSGILLDDAKNKIDKKTEIVSVSYASNVLGCVNDIVELRKIAHENGALFILDGAQAVPHFPVDVKKIDCDFLAFSGHKMLGPMGIGCLFGKKEILDNMEPFQYGGDMIREVRLDDTKFNSVPMKFEAGTPNVSGAIGLASAVRYLESHGMDHIQYHGKELVQYAEKRLSEMKDINIYGAKNKNGLISFNVDGVHAHDTAQILAEKNIAVRSGHMCCMPLIKKLGVPAIVRASFYLYNTEDDVDRLVDTLHDVRNLK